MYCNMNVKEGSVYNQRGRYCVFYCKTDSPLGSETDKIINKHTVKHNCTSCKEKPT
jgi:hypothetical protein